MGIIVSPEERFRDAQREVNQLRQDNLDLMEMLAEQMYYQCLNEMGVNVNDL